MKAAVYFHVPLDSRWEQSREQELAKEFLKSRPDLKLIRTYADYGPTAGSRSALLSLLQDAEEGAFHVLVVRAPGVLSQNTPEILEIYDYLSKKNVQVLFYSGKTYPLNYWTRQYSRMCKELSS